MKRIIISFWMLAIGFLLVSSPLLAAEEVKKEKAPAPLRVRGELIPHTDTKDIKVLLENYETVTVLVNEKTRIEPAVRGSLEYLAQEAELRLPRGEITYTEIDGKLVATRVTYNSNETWKMDEPKPREE